MGAQNRLGQGLEQTRNAFFGLPTDLSFAQNAQPLNIPSGLFNQQLPTFDRPDLTRPQPQQETPAEGFGRLVRGLQNNRLQAGRGFL